ncbi:GntR family transcriptional regulator [Nitratireductor mangrovi]|uniref:GntR family transcriptional regulator n=1 Tax=Nitratireductor mangrovi TaxID=2599600 RepID=A0A5B8KZX5_9HYPH|nr:GntR family transcriptional regulator [Nitratireductor mangrovi]QDZ01307.1 GntR family transcriptional regulator [Nitratireductor mangrovi]
MSEVNRRPGPGRQQSQAPELDAINVELAETVERQVYRSIRQAMMSGRVAPGTSLTSRSLAQVLKVSAQPVRDALKRLEADGVLEGRPQSGFLLRHVSQQEYREIIEIRQRLEGLAGRVALSSMNIDTIGKLERINVRMSRLDSAKEALAENYRFHFTIYRMADRPTLLALIENLWVRMGPALHHHPYKINSADTMERHDEIITALKNRDPDAVESAIAEDLGAAANLVVPRLPK